MRALFLVIRRELAERWLLWPASLIAGMLAALLPLLPWSDSSEPDLVRGVMALVGSTLLGGGTLVLLGASVLCREWTESRLGFYLARPVPAASLWLGKLAATVILALSATFLVTAPSLLAGSNPWFQVEYLVDPKLQAALGLNAPLIVPIAACFVALAAHGLGVVTRLRGLASLIDLTLFIVLGLVAADHFRRFSASGYEPVVVRWATVVLASLFVALGVAGWAQIRWAGTDATRAHHVWSVVVWGGLAALLGGIEMTTDRLDRPTIDHVEEIAGLWPVDATRTVVLGRIAPWSNRAFLLVDSATERSIPLGTWPQQQHPPLLSPNGRWLVWPEREKKLPYDLHLLDLADPESGPTVLATLGVDSSVALRSGVRSFAVGNEWVAAYGLFEPQVIVRRLDGSEPTRRIPLPFAWTGSEHLSFLDDDRLRVWLSPIIPKDLESNETLFDRVIDGLVVLDIDPELASHVEVARRCDLRFRRLSADGRYLVAADDKGRESVWASDLSTHLVSLPRFIVRQALPFELSTDGVGSQVLADGRFVHLEQRPPDDGRPGAFVLRVFHPDGRPESSIDLPLKAFLGPEIEPGRLLVATRSDRSITRQSTWTQARLGSPIAEWSTRVIDLQSGETLRTVDGFVPLPGSRPAESPGQDWLIDGRGWPVRLDPATGALSAVPGFERGRR